MVAKFGITVSRLFQPLNIVPRNVIAPTYELSKSQKLLLDLGFVRPASPGFFNLLPLAERVLTKLTCLVDKQMAEIGAQKVLLPHLSSCELWKTSGRWKTGEEIFTLNDRHEREYVLCPTHEEIVTELLSSIGLISYRQLPVLLYQISSKFRDEIRPRFGLLRSKEFVMKDLYSFDISASSANETYAIVQSAYAKIFQKLGMKFMKVASGSGMMGGKLSHEYHFPADVGEDRLLICLSCNYGVKHEVTTTESCPDCKIKFTEVNGIEVGHTFILGTRYSEPLNVTFLAKNGKPQFIEMGCYGLGITRILAASAEILSTDKELRWPSCIAPYSVCIIPPKEGSKESPANIYTELIFQALQNSALVGDVIVDDRTQLTIGKRLLEGKRTGYSYIIVIGKEAISNTPLFEIHNTLENLEELLTLEALTQYVIDKCDKKL